MRIFFDKDKVGLAMCQEYCLTLEHFEAVYDALEESNEHLRSFRITKDGVMMDFRRGYRDKIPFDVFTVYSNLLLQIKTPAEDLL